MTKYKSQTNGQIETYSPTGCLMDNKFYGVTKDDLDQIKTDKGALQGDLYLKDDRMTTATHNYGLIDKIKNISGGSLVKVENNKVTINENITKDTSIVAIGQAMSHFYRNSPFVPGGALYPDFNSNPESQGASRALIHAMLGIHASYEFYFYMLAKGYIYKDNHSPSIGPGSLDAFASPFLWFDTLRHIATCGSYPSLTQGTFVIPSHGHLVKSNCEYNFIQDCDNPFGYVNGERQWMVQEPTIAPGGGMVNRRNYGTKLSPSCNLSKDQQLHLNNLGANMYLLVANGAAGDYSGISKESLMAHISRYSPLNNFAMQPAWCREWSSAYYTQVALEEHAILSNTESNIAPIYDAVIEVALNEYFDYLINVGLIESNPAEAGATLDSILVAAPGTDGSGGFLDIFNIGNGGLVSVFEGDQGALPVDFEIAEGLTFSPFQEAIIDEVKKQTPTNQETFAIGEIFPNSTHYINNEISKVFNNRLQTQNSVVYEHTKYSKSGEARIQKVRNYKKEKMTSFTLPYGTTVEVLEEFISGDDGLYHRIQVADPNGSKFGSKEAFFIKAKLLSKLEGTPPSMNTIFNNYVKQKEKVEWINMKDEEIFFDRNLLAYSVVIEPIDSLTGKKIESMLDCSDKVEVLEKNSMRIGIQALLACHNKSMFINGSTAQTVNYLLDGVFKFAYTGDSIIESKKGLSWYLDPRPRSKVKFIVRIPAKYFDAIPQKAETFDDIPHFKKKLFTSHGNQPIDSAPTPSAGVSDFRITSLLTCNIKHKIDLATSIMEKYRDQIDAWDGEVEGLDLDLEIKRLKQFPQAMQKFAVENKIGYSQGNEDELEIGCNSKFRLKYISYVKAGLSKPLRICFNRFKRKTPVKYSRTMAYIYYLDDIVELERKLTSGVSNQQQMNWVEFVQKYTYPMPAIRPSSRKRTNPLSPSALLDGKENKAEKLSQKFDKQIELTIKGLDAQRLEISKPDLKLELALARLKQKDFSGDLFVEQIPQLVDQIRNLAPSFDGLQDLFTLVFDKIDISALSSISAGSLAFDMPTVDVEGSFALAALDSPEISGLQFDKILDFLPEVSIGKIKKIESYFDGSISISDLEGEFPDDVLNTILSFYETKEEKITPVGREADIMKNGSLEDIKCLGLDTKYGTTSPRLNETQNIRKELVKIVVSPSDLASAIRNVTPDIINAMSEVGELSTKDVPSLSLSPLKKVAVKFPSPPTLTIPRLPDIDDTMPNISKDLTSGLEQILATTLIEISAVLLETVFNSVFSSAQKLGQSGVDAFPSEFGGQDMNELLEDFKPENQYAVENALKKLGIGPSTEDYDVPIDSLIEELSKGSEGGDSALEPTDKNSRQLITEISSVLTPLEVVDLLEGNPSTETITIVEAVMGEGNQVFLDSINRTTSVKQLFKSLGKLADPNKLEAIRNTVDQILPNPSGLLCEYENFSSIGEKDSPGDVIRRRALEGKLDKECVETQMSEIRQRKTKRLANLLALANGKDLLSGMIPPMIGSCGKGLINKNHQTVEHMNEKLVNAIFDPMKMNFSTEANSLPAAFTENTMRAPSQYDDQYDGLKAALATAGIEGIESSKDIDDKFIQDGLEQLFAPKDDAGDPSKQQKFNTAASAFQVIDGTVAPKVRGQYVGNISSILEGKNSIDTSYEKISLNPELASFDEAKNKVDSKIAKLSNLQQQKEQGIGDIFEINQQIAELKTTLGNRTDKNEATYFGKYNLALEKISKIPEDQRRITDISFASYNHSSKDTGLGQVELGGSSDYEILDTWRLYFYPPTQKIMNFQGFQTSKGVGHTIEGSKDIEEIVPNEAYNYDFYPEYNERDQVFSNFIKNKWEEVIPNPAIDFFPTEGGLNFFYRDKRAKIFNSLINVFGGLGRNAKTFTASGIQNLQLGAGKSDGNFEVHDQCATPKTDNILGIEDLKRQAKEEYNNACDEASDPSKPSGLEKANLRALMRAAIRMSILDSVSRSIFITSMFSMKDLFADEALCDFMLAVIREDLEAQDTEYYTEFIAQAKEITNEKLKRGEVLIDPFTGIEDKKIMDEADPRTASGYYSLRLMIREEMNYLAPKIDEKTKPKYKNMDKFFLEEMVPSVNVRRHSEENQYHEIIKEVIKDPNNLDFDFDLPSNYKVKTDFKFIEPDSPIFGGGGGFVLEKYVRISDKALTPSELDAMSKPKKDFLVQWFSRRGGINNQSPIVFESEKVDVGKSKEGTYAYTSGAVNIDALVEALQKALNESSIEEIDINDMLEEFTFGVRLVYVPPSEDVKSFNGVTQNYVGATLEDFTPIWNSADGMVVALYNGQLNEALDQENELLSKEAFGPIYSDFIKSNDGDQVKEDAILSVSQKEKLFMVKEKYATFEEKLDTIEILGVPINVLDLKQNIKVKTLYPIELVKAESDYNFLGVITEANGKINLANLINALDDGVATNGIFTALKTKIMNDKNYKFIFHYDIPIVRALALVYIQQYIASTANYPAVGRTYSITKNMIRSSFFNMIPGDPWWSKQDKRIEEQGGNAGMMETANNTMTADGPSGSDMAMKISFMAASIICKAMAAQQDPHYGLMKQLDNFNLTPAGMNWKSVPILYPMNFPLPFPPFMGWGPPMTPLGMVAYTLPMLPGESKKNKNKEQEETEC
jgi:hypothetical protein